MIEQIYDLKMVQRMVPFKLWNRKTTVRIKIYDFT